MADWTTIGWISQDRFLAFAEASIDRNMFRSAVLDGVQVDSGFVACFTDCDDDVPVEVQHDDDVVRSARLCWTNDVDDLDGESGAWIEIASLALGGTCLAVDPVHFEGMTFEVAPGTWLAQAFYVDGDCLGLKISQQGDR